MKLIITLTSLALFSISCSKQEDTAAIASSETVVATETTATAYPLDICLVSGEKLGSMGDPVVMVHEGREIKFCCDACVPRFKEDPEKYLSQLDAQAAE